MTIYINGTTGISGVDGSAGTPAVQGTDTNTGVFYPAADTVGVSTGGSERMRIDTSGLIGIKGAASTSWSSTYQVIQYNAGPALWSANNANINLTSNVYNDGTNRYLTTAGAGGVNLSTGGATITGYSSGTAGNAVTAGASFNVNLTDCVMTTANGGLGYGTGSGGTVTQATNKSTTVTLNKPTGQITMNNASLGASTEVSFTLNNSLISTTDIVTINATWPTAAPRYQAYVTSSNSGSCQIVVKNRDSATAYSEAVVLNFAIIKGATS